MMMMMIDRPLSIITSYTLGPGRVSSCRVSSELFLQRIYSEDFFC
jgi:hypothetical protein